MQNSPLGPLGKRIVAYLVLIAAAILALKVIAAVFIGLLQAVFMVVLILAALGGVFWALRHI
ncbi:MAG TPA: hypothetical protein VES79_05525 [Solirubrobacteraceae bacterium]|nr:hypothetical protein [Solirubrobacteraceae bacterium]